jgi:threonylcarbamoyladenosine tRNA methylthiotransferase MtaB
VSANKAHTNLYFSESELAWVRCYYSTVASFHVQNFGCRATQADGAAIERQFEERGWARAAQPRDAEVVVLNTCTVTASADQDARAAIRRVHRENPQARIVVTGCYAQRSPEELAALPGVAQVIGNSHKHQLAEIATGRKHSGPEDAEAGSGFFPLERLTRVPAEGSVPPTARDPRPIFVSDIFAHTELLAAPVFDAANQRTRPNLKVQDGCNNRCSFCVIPYVRGQSRSMKLEQILREVDALVASGYRELVISGINLGRWGRDFEDRYQLSIVSSQGNHPPADSVGASASLAVNPEAGHPTFTVDQRPTTSDQRLAFEDLIRAVLEHTGLEKLRISSVEPMDWSDELIGLVAGSPRIAKHAHVPMQSGSDAVLRRMHRKYRPWHYREKIERIRTALPTAAIGADVMVGFPGETDAEFEETRCMVDELPLTYLHVFTYSVRPGTPAAEMPRQVPVPVARERNRILRELAEAKKLAFMREFVGKNVEAITLNRFDGQWTEALTENYLPLRVRGKSSANQWVRTRVENIVEGELVGRL